MLIMKDNGASLKQLNAIPSVKKIIEDGETVMTACKGKNVARLLRIEPDTGVTGYAVIKVTDHGSAVYCYSSMGDARRLFAQIVASSL